MTFTDILTIVFVMALGYYFVGVMDTITDVIADAINEKIRRIKEKRKWDRIGRITDLSNY